MLGMGSRKNGLRLIRSGAHNRSINSESPTIKKGIMRASPPLTHLSSLHINAHTLHTHTQYTHTPIFQPALPTLKRFMIAACLFKPCSSWVCICKLSKGLHMFFV
jgi:hypothetical protein